MKKLVLVAKLTITHPVYKALIQVWDTLLSRPSKTNQGNGSEVRNKCFPLLKFREHRNAFAAVA